MTKVRRTLWLLTASYAVVHDHGSPSTYTTTTAARAWDQSARGWVWVPCVVPEGDDMSDEKTETPADRSVHHMVPGSHEFNRGPVCRCGEAWDWWRDECARPDDDEPSAPFERAGLVETIDRIRADLVATEPAALLSEVKRLRSENADLRRSRDKRKAEEHELRLKDRAAFRATIEPELAKQRDEARRLRHGLMGLYRRGTGRSLAPFDPILPFVGRSSANNAVLQHDIEWRDRIKGLLEDRP